MKRFLAVLLCFTMVCTGIDVSGFTQVKAEENTEGTDVEPSALRFEAEEADNFEQGAAGGEHTLQESENFSGGVAVGNMNAWIVDGRSYLTKTVSVEEAGTYLLRVAYAGSEEGNEPTIDVRVNNGNWKSLNAPATPGWDQTSTVSVKVKLKEGENTIDITGACQIWYKDGQAGQWVNIDYFELEKVEETPEQITDVSGKQQTLNALGFDLSGNYKTDELNAGRHALSSMEEVYLEQFGTGAKLYDYDDDTGIQKFEKSSMDIADSSGKELTQIVSFDGTGDGRKDYIAKVSLEDGENGGKIVLSVLKAADEDAVEHAVFLNQDTGGYIKADYPIYLGRERGLLSIAEGDFDGDGIDELAVYTPNNSDEVESTQEPFTPDRLEVKIYDIDVNIKRLPEPVQVIDIAEGTTKWNTSKDSKGRKNFCSIPYLSLTADDADGDGVDDLLMVENFACYYGTIDMDTTYTWKQVLDPDTCLTSMLDIYEGSRTEDAAPLTHTVDKRPLVGRTDDSCAYVLRNAMVVVGNVTGPNSREIIIGGNYTKINYTSSTELNDTVTKTRDLNMTYSVGGNACTIIGYTDYENVKKSTEQSKLAASLQYNWTVQKVGSECIATNYTDKEPVAMIAFAAYGSALPDTVFLEGQLFAYSDNTGKLEYTDYQMPEVESHTIVFSGDKWIANVVAGNVTNSAIGAETVFVTYTRYGRMFFENYWLDYGQCVSIYGTVSGGEKGYDSGVVDMGSANGVCLVDIDDDSSFVEYTSGDTDVYYGDVEVLSVLQAAPVWNELGDYVENAETTYAKSSGSSTGETSAVNVSAGVVAGFEQETSLLGLVKVAGMSFETTVSASVGHETGKTVSKEFTTAYNTTGASDVAVIFTVPYVRYNCKMYMPSYSLPTKEEYAAKKAFMEELEKNLLSYIKYSAGVSGGTYSSPDDGYNNEYTTNVNASNYDSQLKVYKGYIEWLEQTESTMAEFGTGGIYQWGQEIEGGWQDYYYSVPQTPVLTTVDVATYDRIAEAGGELQPIYGNVFAKDYRAGDPSTYAKNISELNASADSEVLSGQTNHGSSADTGGFVTSSSISASSSAPSQTITVSKEQSRTISYGTAIETTLTASVGGASLGATTSVGSEGSNSWITTEGCEYSGKVPNLPENTPDNYSYGWKLVSYTAKLNGKNVPVVGYLTKMTQTAPPSLPDELTVQGVSDQAVELSWTDGNRAAEVYKLYRVTYSNGKTYYDQIAELEKNEKGRYNYTDDGEGAGLEAATVYNYALKAFDKAGIASTYSKIVSATTLPKDADISAVIYGMDSDTVYAAGKDLELTAQIMTSTGTSYKVRSYEWQCNEGTGWKVLDGAANDPSCIVRTSTLKNGYAYRCKLVTRVGNVINGPVYEFYSNTVTQQAKRAAASLNLSAVKMEGASETSVSYGPAGMDKLHVSVQVVPENDVKEDASGTVQIVVTYYKPDETQDVTKAAFKENGTFAKNKSEEAIVKKYQSVVGQDGIAEADLDFNQAGRYEISAEYGGDINYESTAVTDSICYYAYDSSMEEKDIYDFGAVMISLEKDSYEYAGSQICPKVSVKWNQAELTENVDYTVSYGDNNVAGENAGTVIVTPIGHFAGQEERVLNFTIIEKPEDTETRPGDTETEKPGDTETRPGDTETEKPGDTETRPGDTETEKPGDTETKPGGTETEKPGDTETRPGDTETEKPGDTEIKPGDTETKPGDSETTRPGDTETKPGDAGTTKPGDSETTDSGEIKVKSIKIEGESKKIAAGRSIRLTAKTVPENALNASVSWESSNTKYATVSVNGVVKTKKAGAGKNVTITATAKDGSGAKASYKIKIVKHAVKSVTLSTKSKKVKAGKAIRIKAKIKTTGNTANKTLKWTVSNTKYATVSAKGVVKTKKAGKGKTVKITAAATDGTGKKKTITIKIN